MAKQRNKKAEAAAAVIDMRTYDDSANVHEHCIGCQHIFNHFGLIQDQNGFLIQDELPTQKCLVYVNPKAKWPGKEQYATKNVIVLRRDDKGKPISRTNEDLPITYKFCSMATHVQAPEVVEATGKDRAGQQKQKKKR